MKLYHYIAFFTLIRREAMRTKRVIGQAIIAPMVTATLYIFIFGYVIGGSIKLIEGVTYINFVFPGIVAMNIILAVFGATSFSAFFMKFQKTIEDLLTLPISYTELVLSLIAGGVMRALLLSCALAVIAFIFGISILAHPFILLLYVLLVSILFGLLGVIVGFWADNSFEKIGLATNFVLTPLTFLGGVFYSAKMLPEKMQFIVHFNPIYYAVDGIRYALIDYHETSLILGIVVLSVLSSLALAMCVYIFKTGWKIRS